MDDEAWWRFKHQHPHCVAVERSHGDLEVSQLSGHLATREFRNLALFSEFMRPFTTMIVVTLPTAPGRIRMYNLSRERVRPFSERDRLTLPPGDDRRPPG
ncbi:hypothetical protein [Streptomyces prunicolor]|uniref:hypothetical protein n=1 Tax=Streptomyces prunicolor TaxID=67348 RepID=UPI0033FEEB60